MLSSFIIASFAAGQVAYACTPAVNWGQCGGIGWTGPTCCNSGWFCYSNPQNPYYAQCTTSDQAAQSSTKQTSKTSSTVSRASTTLVKSPTTTAMTASKSTSVASVVSSSRAPTATSPSTSGQRYSASFTQYGSTDTWGSGNCNVASVACGHYTSPGYSAAVSQNLFGVGTGAGAGPACGGCWRLTIQTDSSGQELSNAGTSIVVKVTNLCPVEGNPLCAQNGLSGANQYGANVNFDTCIDSGASAALFGNSGVGLGLGTAEAVSCFEWSGTDI